MSTVERAQAILDDPSLVVLREWEGLKGELGGYRLIDSHKRNSLHEFVHQGYHKHAKPQRVSHTFLQRKNT
ncbi:hypothetical protein KSC_072120 [Ktedonobacter sp. SOSP1-52]|uniref:hypothetical protein n=1 Tax=Ktedonobacter sp. SOSP1-52 TaxID=2778366 RepID=UPI0019151669|nr:hypothetical protein [Ktedonobacter sp. SOSP1-52]GHO68320.1 hypothetical protein KSC_072120 [Ktedonobacter sp. SOSP1-52]